MTQYHLATYCRTTLAFGCVKFLCNAFFGAVYDIPPKLVHFKYTLISPYIESPDSNLTDIAVALLELLYDIPVM